MKRCLALLAILALAACGQSEAPASAPIATPAAEAPTAGVAALDEFGPFEGRVNDVAFWVHPSVPFNSMAIVATDKGLLALNIEDGKEVARVEGFKAGAVEVVYEDVYSLTDPEGYKSRGVVVVRDADAKSIRFFDVHNATRTLGEIGEGFPAGEVEAFCAGPQFLGPTRLVILSERKMRTYDLTVGKDAVTVAPTQQTRDSPAAANACVIGKREGELFVLYETGEIARFIEHTGRRMEVFTPTRIKNPIGLDLALNGAASDGDESDCCGQVAVLDAGAATIRFYDYDDGKAFGGVNVKASFDVAAVEEATAFGLGQGNFGGPYRNGVVALAPVASHADKPVLRLAALSGALEALAVKFGDTHNPRIMNPNPLEYQCKEQEAPGERVAECDPYRDSPPSAALEIPTLAAPEFAPPPPRDVGVESEAAAPASDE